ncbi:alkaline phosphatase PafA [Dyadobacter fermentans]|uniref:Type I phosphodiesterase/nucleotide pyrophosphatase n=1 Tax=Dyadobacter fermentans (strain ATCC 700827 / DSM 18053 / CIP 107007 / KCTC 52180 / NS114) TaxID=471854 RepID=C6VZL9_DYAFD|nr:alkaline phosphatase PafA [Dyadobacter fermentans]ACT93497.1 type I phosphodiesterase/nucleotide pyrophosphatase [Dyadobacter fermentans DSM 18053]
MFLKSAFIFASCLLAFTGYSQPGTSSTALPRPKLVVGIVIDQMRYDYLYRYYDKYQEGGFKRMLNEGFNCRDHHYHYANTSTGPGHASVYTGSSPAIHGILANDWYVPALNKNINCVADSTVSGLGTAKNGKGSPRNMLVTTVTDQLRIAQNFRSKTISIALKDRSAVLPGGHTSNASYWYDGDTGNFVTSSYYMSELPEWVRAFNAKKLPIKYLDKGWKPLLPLRAYQESTADDQAYEEGLDGNEKPVFPYKLASSEPDLAGSTPWGNTLTKDMALAAIRAEKLGRGEFTDFLALSFSAPDGVGHKFGPNSIEQQDLYLRLDQELAELFSFLDSWTGKGNYTVFLTADHGVMDVPEFLVNNKIPAGRYSSSEIFGKIKKDIASEFSEDFVKAISSGQIHLDKKRMKQKGVSVAAIQDVIRQSISEMPAVANVVNLRNLEQEPLTDLQKQLFRNDYNPKRSGDLLLVMQPHWIGRGKHGTTHGTSYNYDTQVPFLLFGWGVKHGETFDRTYISDIAPTVSALLHILPPSGSMGKIVGPALVSTP